MQIRDFVGPVRPKMKLAQHHLMLSPLPNSFQIVLIVSELYPAVTLTQTVKQTAAPKMRTFIHFMQSTRIEGPILCNPHRLSGYVSEIWIIF